MGEVFPERACGGWELEVPGWASWELGEGEHGGCGPQNDAAMKTMEMLDT